MPVMPEYESMSSLDGGMPVLPLRRTFFPGASGLDGGMPVLPLRRTFFPGASGLGDFTYSYTHPRTGRTLKGYKFITTPGVNYGRPVLESFRVAGLDGGMPVLPLKRTFFPGASGLGDKPGADGGHWVILDATGKPVAIIRGNVKKLSSAYKKVRVSEYFNAQLGQQVFENQNLIGFGAEEESTPWDKAEKYASMNKSAMFGLGQEMFGFGQEGAPVTAAAKFTPVEEESTPWDKAEKYASMNKSAMFGLGAGADEFGMFGPEPQESMGDVKGLF